MASGQKAASSCSPLSAALSVAACCCSGLTEWKLALGSGSWVGGIEVETFDELCFEKIYVSKSLNLNPKGKMRLVSSAFSALQNVGPVST